jgi:hypothetical protein
MDLYGPGWEDLRSIYLGQDRDKWREFCECHNEHSGFMTCGKFLNWLRKLQLLK